jgi:quinol monooxygenase YgiN
MFHVIVNLEVNPECLNEFRERISVVVTQSRLEPGCVRFDVCQSEETELKYVLIEAYRTKEGYLEHTNTVHFNDFKGHVNRLLKSKTSIKGLELF